MLVDVGEFQWFSPLRSIISELDVVPTNFCVTVSSIGSHLKTYGVYEKYILAWKLGLNVLHPISG